MDYKCEICGETVQLMAENLTTKMQGDVTLTFHECPACGGTSLVQVDNLETEALLKEVQMLTTKRLARMIRNQQLPKKQIEKLVRLDKKLDYMRKELFLNYSDTLSPIEGN